MLNVLRRAAPRFAAEIAETGWAPPEDAIWIDLRSPTRDEELAVEKALGIELPTQDEMAQLEPSSRLYQENHATFMTATLLARSAEGPTAAPVTFVLAKGLLITIRYDELRAFTVFGERAPQADMGSGSSALLGLLDAIVERLSEVLEETAGNVEAASAAIFRTGRSEGGYQPLLTELAKAQSVTSTTRTSLVSLGRLLSFATLAQEISSDVDCSAHLKSLQADAVSLTEHASFQSTHISFLLDAALGLINIEQNGIIKIFSVMAVIFMPPTLVASIYGMNFHHMPELSWPFGYPMALCLMVASAIVPVLWFKRRGWF
jgi:magnesium transporter